MDAEGTEIFVKLKLNGKWERAERPRAKFTLQTTFRLKNSGKQVKSNKCRTIGSGSGKKI